MTRYVDYAVGRPLKRGNHAAGTAMATTGELTPP